MKIYDISQELFSSVVYPGDTPPTKRTPRRIANGDTHNLTELDMCAHNGTHVDAPYHFISDGKTIDMIALDKFVGRCYVAEFSGVMTADDARAVLERASAVDARCARRILLKGDLVVSNQAAEAFAQADIDLIGVESQSVGELTKPMIAHKILLSREIVLLEGIRLAQVPEGEYLLNCAPINLGGADGAPCRAILLDGEI